MTRTHDERDPVSLHDVLEAWQAGRLPYRQALSLTGMSVLTELYEAASNSGVDIRSTMLPDEERAAARATEALKARGFMRHLPAGGGGYGR